MTSKKLTGLLVAALALAAPVAAQATPTFCGATNPGISSCSFSTGSGNPAGLFLAIGTGSWNLSMSPSTYSVSGSGPALFSGVPCAAGQTVTASALTPSISVFVICFP